MPSFFPVPSALGTLAIIVDGYWRLGIGDPTAIGWLTVLAYLTTSVLCCKFARKTRAGHGPHQASPAVEWMIWYFLAFFTLGLGINKQLDLQVGLTALSKKLAVSQGWYDHRRLV